MKNLKGAQLYCTSVQDCTLLNVMYGPNITPTSYRCMNIMPF